MRTLPILVLMPHSRCDCRCVMCDIWKANAKAREITTEDLAPHLDSFRHLGVKRVLLSGGEPLMHSNLWAFCRSLRNLGVRIMLLSTGLALKEHASQICLAVDEVIVSLDAAVRAFTMKSGGFHGPTRDFGRRARVKGSTDPRFRVTGRCVLQKNNFMDIQRIVAAARSTRAKSDFCS